MIRHDTGSAPMWTRSSADEFLESTRELFARMGLTLKVVGSVAITGQSDKDLDVLVEPLDGKSRLLELALKDVLDQFVPVHTVDSNSTLNPLPSDVPEEQIFVNLGLKDGRTLELFFPERHFPLEAFEIVEAPSPTPARKMRP